MSFQDWQIKEHGGYAVLLIQNFQTAAEQTADEAMFGKVQKEANKDHLNRYDDLPWHYIFFMFFYKGGVGSRLVYLERRGFGALLLCLFCGFPAVAFYFQAYLKPRPLLKITTKNFCWRAIASKKTFSQAPL